MKEFRVRIRQELSPDRVRAQIRDTLQELGGVVVDNSLSSLSGTVYEFTGEGAVFADYGTQRTAPVYQLIGFSSEKNRTYRRISRALTEVMDEVKPSEE